MARKLSNKITIVTMSMLSPSFVNVARFEKRN
jgi:hypothetical protein